MPWPTSLNHPHSYCPNETVRLTLNTAPATEVWTSTNQEVLDALKLGTAPADSAYVDLVLKAARRYFERITGLALITQSWKATLDRVPPRNKVDLPKAPLIDLTNFDYLDTAGAPQAGTDTDFAPGNVGCDTSFGFIRLKDTASWPAIGTDPDALSFTFTAGYGAAATNVPAEVRTALLMLSAHWYENRLPVSEGHIVTGFPIHLQSLIELCRVAALV